MRNLNEDGFAASSAPSMSDEIEASEEDTELTAHEYARECGLCTAYLRDNPLLILPIGFSRSRPAAGSNQSKPDALYSHLTRLRNRGFILREIHQDIYAAMNHAERMDHEEYEAKGHC